MEPENGQLLQSSRGVDGHMLVGGRRHQQQEQQELSDSERPVLMTSQPAEQQSVPRTRSIRTSLLAFSQYPQKK